MKTNDIVSGVIFFVGYCIGGYTAISLQMKSINDHNLVIECEANLPRTQHCEIIKTAAIKGE